MTQIQELRTLMGSAAERQQLLEAIQPELAPQHYAWICKIVELVVSLLTLLEKKDLSIAKLLQLCFGATTESARHLKGQPPKPKDKPKAKGHGRNSHRNYTGARRIVIAHPTMKAGQQCDECKKGKLRRRKEPVVAITVSAQPPIGAVIHEMEQLRCDTCGKLFTAPTPKEAGPEKYDASVGVMVGLMRYGSGMPFYRLERLQKSVGVPLPASVQWEQVDRAKESLKPIYEHLIVQSAQGSVMFTDDTKMQVQALRQEIEKEAEPKRTGIFTTGLVSKVDEHTVTLFFTGRKHAGENLARVLEHREGHRSPPIHMCDGLAQNVPKGHETVDCQCNVHARRGFVELNSVFPEESLKVVESFSAIYRVEAQIKRQGLSAEERLRVHQEQSGPVMEELKRWFTELLDEKKVEPNSGLGGAIAYMQKRWEELTQFLRVAGAPLDNNSAEIILKRAILHRKNSLHYRTTRGAEAGDIYMSVIETCRQNGVNPFEYMMAVVNNAALVRADPGRWMPWNYRTALADVTVLTA